MNLRKSKIWINALAIIALLAAVFLKNGPVSTILIMVCAAAALVVLYKNLAGLSNVSEDNPKLKSVKFITIFNVVYIAVVVAIAVFAERLAESGAMPRITETHAKLLMALLFAVPMATFGNVAPKLPFNRYTGLRLPWTVRDEDTWIVAHRILGYISIPLAILLFVHVPTAMRVDTYIKFWLIGDFVLWIAVPSILSGIFFYRKRNRNP